MRHLKYIIMAINQLSSIIPDEVLINKIYLLRNQKVMLDRDLADLYGVESRRLREQVKRNTGSFPSNFMFQLSTEEVEVLVSQNVIPSKGSLGGSLPYVFTEHGVLMLANVLRSSQAISVSIRIIEIFITLRDKLLDNIELRNAIMKLDNVSKNNSKNIELIFNYIEELSEKPTSNFENDKIGFKLTKKQ